MLQSIFQLHLSGELDRSHMHEVLIARNLCHLLSELVLQIQYLST